MLECNRYKEAVIYAGLEAYPVLIDIQTDTVVEAFIRGKWVSAKYYSIWQEFYDAQKAIKSEPNQTEREMD